MERKKPGWVGPATEYGPLALFFVAYSLSGLMAATLVMIITAPIGLAVGWFYERKIPVVPTLTAAVIILFGGLTLWLNDETFIKMKPTIIQAAFGLILCGGLLFKKSLLEPLMGKAWRMTAAGWRALTLRFALYFFVMAGLNEVIWRTQSTDFWVNFKVFGTMGLMMVFILSQYPLMRRHHLPDD